MALTPIDYVVDADTNETTETAMPIEPSKTWLLDFEKGRISGYIDGTEAIRQYIRKALITARNRYLIYDEEYGEDVRELIGQSLTQSLIDVEIPRLIREAIIYDDRIASVPDVVATRLGDDVYVSVTVELTEGGLITEEVAI